MNRLVCAVLLILALSACNHLRLPVSENGAEPRPVVDKDQVEAREVAALVGYASKVAGSGTDEQRRELAAAVQNFSRDRGVPARLRLALLLSLPGTGFADDARALTLLEPLANAGVGSSATPLRQFASLMYLQLGERVREQRRSAQLKEQLDGLRSIERSLMERGQGKHR
jgi:hypothetical protein